MLKKEDLPKMAITNNKIDTTTNLLKFNIINERLYFNEIDITDSVINYDLHGGDILPIAHHLKIELMIQI